VLGESSPSPSHRSAMGPSLSPLSRGEGLDAGALPRPVYGERVGVRGCVLPAPYPHNLSLAMRAPSVNAASLAQAIDGTTMLCCAAKVAKPQSVPAMTRSRPTSRA
jgi:hypothetical protein